MKRLDKSMQMKANGGGIFDSLIAQIRAIIEAMNRR